MGKVSIINQEIICNLQKRRTSQTGGKKCLPQISKNAEQVKQAARNACLKSPKTQNKSINRQQMLASNLQKRRTSQSSGKKWLPQISKIAKQVNQVAGNGCLKSPKSQNKSIKWQQMVASNLQNRKTSQSSGRKWLPQISKIAKQVNQVAGNGCLKSPKTQNKSNILSHIGQCRSEKIST